MDVKTIAMIALALSIIAIIIAVVAFTGTSAEGTVPLGLSSTKYQCSDKIDNDGDGKVDMNDAGCSSRNDNDESNCGDIVCEGGETCTSCTTDCGACPTTSIITTTIPNSCSDTDGGTIFGVKGTVSGYYNSQLYSNTDYCSGSTGVLVEYYCSAGSSFNTAYNCVGNSTTSCVDGDCI